MRYRSQANKKVISAANSNRVNSIVHRFSHRKESDDENWKGNVSALKASVYRHDSPPLSNFLGALRKNIVLFDISEMCAD